jgi:hypothetical protein
MQALFCRIESHQRSTLGNLGHLVEQDIRHGRVIRLKRGRYDVLRRYKAPEDGPAIRHKRGLHSLPVRTEVPHVW